MTSRALIIQLARLGDLVQSLPVVAALATCHPSRSLDLLCPAPLAPLAGCFSLVDRVLGWNGAQWQAWADSFTGGFDPVWLREVEQSLTALTTESYGKAYVLNQHPRAILAGALLATEVQGPYLGGPLDEALSPWASYL